jgi:hypothetical protein
MFQVTTFQIVLCLLSAKNSKFLVNVWKTLVPEQRYKDLFAETALKSPEKNATAVIFYMMLILGSADAESCKNNPCCDGKTCKYKSGAQCSDNNDLCCQNCIVKPKDTICRPKRGDCDLDEKCDGQSGTCPRDSYIDDLTTCTIEGGAGGQCASGDCTSRNQQCVLKGSSIGIVGECPGYSDQCSMYCQGSDRGACVQISGYFIDGSPCSYGGKCYKGECQVDPFGRLIGWAQSHLATAIAILVMVCVIVLCCVGRCVQLCIRKRRLQGSQLQRGPVGEQETYPADVFLAHSGVPVPVSISPAPNTAPLPKGWVDPALYNGAYSGDEVDLSRLENRNSRPTSITPKRSSSSAKKTSSLRVSIQNASVSLDRPAKRSSSLSPSRSDTYPRSSRRSRMQSPELNPPEVPDKD